MKTNQFISLIIFAGFFAITGIGVLISSIGASRSALQTFSWPYVTGQIITSRVSELSDSDGTVYDAEIQYTYDVRSRQYTGNRVSQEDTSFSDSRDAEKIVARYPAGQDVKVYYDPFDPQQSELETVFPNELIMPLIMGTFFTLFGGLLMIYFTSLFLRTRGQSN